MIITPVRHHGYPPPVAAVLRGGAPSCPCPALVGVAVADGVVSDHPPSTSGHVDNDGIQDERAAASTTDDTATFASASHLPIPTTPALLADPPPDAIPTSAILDGAPALLPMSMVIGSLSFSVGERRCSSGGPRKDRRTRTYSPPLPTAAVFGVAWRGIDRPSVLFNAALNATPPRPGPASLLPSSLQPQLGHSMPRGGRVGVRPRAAGTASAGARCSSFCAASRGKCTHNIATSVSRDTVTAYGRFHTPLGQPSARVALARHCAANDAAFDQAANSHNDVHQGAGEGIRGRRAPTAVPAKRDRGATQRPPGARDVPRARPARVAAPSHGIQSSSTCISRAYLPPRGGPPPTY